MRHAVLLGTLLWLTAGGSCIHEGGGVISPGDDIEYSAIKTIHKQLDDNADGSLDFSESAEFEQTELCEGPGRGREETKEDTIVCTGSEKSLKFHQTDTQITSTELWVTWHKNEVFNWTNRDVLTWLEDYVELPEYSSAFAENHITGRQLPHIAINAGQILQNTLSITDGQHKQKLQLRAMDVVLFGPPVKAHWKDIILKVLVLLTVCGVICVLWQRRASKSRIDSFMEDLRQKEEEVKRLKAKFETLERESAVTDGPIDDDDQDMRECSPILMMAPAPTSSGSEDDSTSIGYCKSCSSQVTDSQSTLSQAQESIDLLHQRVWLLEEELNARNSDLQRLQEILPECQQKEREHLEVRKSIGEEQMARAQRSCEKIRKRRSTLFGTFHLANSSVLEEAGLQITKAVNKMHLISECFEEYHKRWNKISHLCGFQVFSPSEKSPPDRPVLSSHLRYSQRSFLHEQRLSEMVHPSSSSSLYNPKNPLTRDTLTQLFPRGQSFHMPPHHRFPLKSHFSSASFQLPDLKDTPAVDRVLTDSIESASSSNSSLSGIVTTSKLPRHNSEGEELSQRARGTTGEVERRRGRGGSVDFGRSMFPSDQEDKLVMVVEEKLRVLETGSVSVTLEEEKDRLLSQARSHSSPAQAGGQSSSPRSQGVRSRGKKLVTTTTI